MKGSYTIEIALLSPWIIISVIFLWYLGFFQHNKVVCQAICKEAAYAGLEAKRCKEDVEAAVHNVLNTRCDWLPGDPQIEKEANIRGNEICVRMDLTMEYPFSFFPGTVIDEEWKVSEEVTLSFTEPVKVIKELRKIEKLKNGLEESS